MLDKLSLEVINTLHPANRVSALAILQECNEELTGRAIVRFHEGYRTAKRSDHLFSLGRTVVNPDGKKPSKPLGNIVSNAKAWQSIHNYGMAIDIVLVVDSKTYKWDNIGDYDGDGIADWMECVKIFKAHGWEWGGDWTRIKDYPHFQFDHGYSWQKLNEMRLAGKLIKGTDFIDISKPVLVTNVYRAISSLNFRNAGSTLGKVISVITKGETVSEISRSGTWSKVAYKGIIGFVSNIYLAK